MQTNSVMALIEKSDHKTLLMENEIQEYEKDLSMIVNETFSKYAEEKSRLLEKLKTYKSKKFSTKIRKSPRNSSESSKIPKLLSNSLEEKPLAKSPNLVITKEKPVNKDSKNFMNVKRNFQSKKSLSQMDFQQARNASRFAKDMSSNNFGIKPIIYDGENEFNRTLQVSGDFYDFIHFNEPDPKLAGMKIFSTIMLNAWRRRRDDVKRLADDLSASKKSNLKVKNQMHVVNSLFKIEQKQNDELKHRLKEVVDEQRHVQSLYNDLNMSFMGIQDMNSKLEKHFDNKSKECENLELVLSETRAQLFKSMQRERELDSSLSSEQKVIQELENSKMELIGLITQLRYELCEKQIRMQEKSIQEDEQITKLKNLIKSLEDEVQDNKKADIILKNYENLDSSQRKTIEELNKKVLRLQNEIDFYLPNRMRNFALKCFVPEKTFKLLHQFLFYLLPAMPPPKAEPLPKIIGLKKVFGFIRN